MIAKMFSRKWILTTLLVLVAVGVMIRLGVWQLERLERRKAFNARVSAQTSQPVLELTGNKVNADLTEMEYRSVEVQGIYVTDDEIALRNQYWNNQWGVHLVTPLKISGSDQFVLVDRGWIPGEAYQSGDWGRFAESGEVTVNGVIRLSQSKAELGRRSDPIPAEGDGPLKTWNFVNIPPLAEQMNLSLLPVYVQQAPDPSWSGLPQRSQPELDLSEGPHMGYALQWFMFAAILGLGYPFYLQRQETRYRAEKKFQVEAARNTSSESKSTS